MSLEPTVTLQLDLKTAIAYEFFMSHIDEAMLDEDLANAVKLVAECGFHFADIFVSVKEQHKSVIEIKSKEETNDQ